MTSRFREDMTSHYRIDRLDVPVHRIAFLPTDDRKVMDLYFKGGMTIGNMAGLWRMPRWAMSRRIRRLMKRLASRPFMAAVRALPYLSAPRARLARLRFCHGMSINALGRWCNVPRHIMRRRIARLVGRIAEVLASTRGRSAMVRRLAAERQFDGRAARPSRLSRRRDRRHPKVCHPQAKLGGAWHGRLHPNPNTPCNSPQRDATRPDHSRDHSRQGVHI